jgi:hypothetical protein
MCIRTYRNKRGIIVPDNIEYTDQTLVIPADVCKILERDSLIDVAEDFGLSIEIENGKVKIADLMEYIAKGYEGMEPEVAWDLVRKWWDDEQEANKYSIAIGKKQGEIAKLQKEISALVKKQVDKKQKWRLW